MGSAVVGFAFVTEAAEGGVSFYWWFGCSAGVLYGFLCEYVEVMDEALSLNPVSVSGCFRTLFGARCFVSIMSFVGPVRKCGMSAFRVIRDILLGKSFFNDGLQLNNYKI